MPRVYGALEARKRRDPEYPSLGWAGIGYRKRETPVNYALANEAFYRSMDNDDESQRFRVRRRQLMRGSYDLPEEMESHTPYNREYLYAKRKRNAVSKRSSNYYANHHKRFANKEQLQKKFAKKATGTDPKIMKDLKSLFDIKDNKTDETAEKKAIPDKKVAKKSDKSDVKKASFKDETTTHAEHERNLEDARKKRTKQPDIDEKKRVDEEHLNIKKKSLDWSNYFGYDRRKKSRQNPTDIDDEWLMERYQNVLASAAKKSTEYPLKYFKNHDERKKKQDSDNEERKKKDSEPENSNEVKLGEMDTKLRNIEDLIIDEALKYTGAHEGATDSKEIQEVKDKVIARLAEAYSLEKMRKALGEFKSTVSAQRAYAKCDEDSGKEPGPEENQMEERKREEEDEKRSRDKKFQKEKKEDYRSENELNLEDNQRSLMLNPLSGKCDIYK